MKHSIERAKKLATEYHFSQRYGDKSYSYHLQTVFDIACEFIYELYPEDISNALQVAWLHDILEDTSITRAQLEDKTSKDVSDNVWRVTDEEGASRAERKIKTWYKIRQTEVATFVKLCDRLANVRERGKLDMYRKEHPVFKAALYVPGQFESLWAEIDEILKISVD